MRIDYVFASAVNFHSHGNFRFTLGLKLSMYLQQYFSLVGGAKFQPEPKLTQLCPTLRAGEREEGREEEKLGTRLKLNV